MMIKVAYGTLNIHPKQRIFLYNIPEIFPIFRQASVENWESQNSAILRRGTSSTYIG